MKKLFATLILIFALISCDDPLFLDGDRNERDKDNGETISLEFKEIFNSNYHYHNELTERMTFVAKSKEEESKIYEYITWLLAVPQQFPEIDYDNKMLLCIVMPPQSSGSNKLKISDVKLQNGKILVSSELLIPEIGTDDIGYPVVFIEIDKRSEPVEFLETEMVNVSSISNEDISNKTWVLNSIIEPNGTEINVKYYKNNEEEVVDLPFSVSFNSDYTFVGLANCHTYNGKYTLENGLEITKMNKFQSSCDLKDLYEEVFENAYNIELNEKGELIIYSNVNSQEYVLNYSQYGNSSEPKTYDINNTTWKLTRVLSDKENLFQMYYLDGSGNSIRYSDEDYELYFKNDEVLIQSNCEKFTSKYYINADGNSMSINEVMSTIDCGFNFQFIEFLINTSKFEVISPNKSSLRLQTEDGKTNLEFLRVYEHAIENLINDNKYVLESAGYMKDSLNIDVENYENKGISLDITKEGGISGNGICNEYFGEFKNVGLLGKTNVEVAYTKKGCNDDFEQLYFDAFNKITHFRYMIMENKLWLYYHSDNEEDLNLMIFKLK